MWNPSIKVTIGEGNFGLYREVSLSQGYRFVLKRLLGTYQCGLSRESVLTSGVVVKKDSTVFNAVYLFSAA